MIVGNIKNAERYYSVHPFFKEVFDSLKNIDEKNPEGFENDHFRFSIVKPEFSDDTSDVVMEAHRDYIDIHYCIEGSEGMGYADIATLTPTTEYNQEDDYILLKGDFAKLILNEGDFCIVFPEDAHAPGMRGNSDTLTKAVVKVKL